MSLKPFLYTSIAANVILFGVVAHLLEDAEEVASQPSAVIEQTPVAQVEKAEISGGKAAELYAKVKSCGVPIETANAVLASTLSANGRGIGSQAYWVSPLVRESTRKIAAIEAMQEGRQLLLQIVGDSAAEKPEFREFFRPLDSDLPFLSSSKQIQIESLRLDALRQTATLVAGNPSAQAPIERRLVSAIKKLLTPEESKEYDVRESPAGKVLLASGFDFTEKEYRSVLAIVADDATPQTNLESTRMQKVREVLGDERFALFRRTQDPVYRQLKYIASLREVPSRNIDAAYALFAGGAAPSLVSIEAGKREELKQLLGRETFSDLEQSLGKPPVAISRSPGAFVTFPNADAR